MKSLTTKQLENSMICYRDLINVPVADNGDPLVIVDPKVIKNEYPQQMADMAKILDNKIVLRKSVVSKIIKAQRLLRKRNNKYSLFVTYGYRSLEIQTAIFRTIGSRIAKKRFFARPIDFYEEIHRFIAVPTVAGHPTGGAVDIAIVDESGVFIDFGGLPDDLSSKNCYVFSPNIPKRALRNRLLLRQCMTSVGFAPFDGEWWHFSYGDREWAYYYKKPRAVYSQLSLRKVKNILKGGE